MSAWKARGTPRTWWGSRIIANAPRCFPIVTSRDHRERCPRNFMKIALIGATGFIGSKILSEAVNRGHVVTAICRHPQNVLKHQNVQAVFADVMDTPALE